MGAFGLVCSAKDNLTGQNVAVKKIMKPFSTPVLSKRTYRELKLLKHLKHENVISLSDIFISPLEDMYVRGYPHFLNFIDNLQLLRHRAPRNRFAPTSHLKTSRETVHSILLVPNFKRAQVCPLRRRCPSRSQAQQHLGQRELRFEDLRLRSGPYSRPPDDWLCLNEILQSPGDYAYMAKIRC
jgi:hypothetical protein